MNAKDFCLIFLVIAIWSVNFLFMRTALDEVPPMGFGYVALFVRDFSGGVVFQTACHTVAPARFIRPNHQFRPVRADVYRGLPTGLAALMLQTQVFFTVLIAGVLLREPVLANHL